jgi:hypothetical protein
MNRLIALCALALGASQAYAAGEAGQVWLTEAKMKGSNAIALDLETDGRVAAFQFFINVPGVSESEVDLSSCLSSLPKSHQGGCVFKDGQVRLGAFSTSLSTLPAGMTKIGTIRIKSGKGLGPIHTSDVELSDKDAKVLPSVVHIERDSPQGENPRVHAK